MIGGLQLLSLDTSHFEMSPLNVDALWNIPLRCVTSLSNDVALDTSHFEMSRHHKTMLCCETSQFDMSPLNVDAL